MPEFQSLSLTFNTLAFIAAACVIAVSGWFLARAADRIADITKLGEAVTGALLLGAATSLPELATSIAAVVRNHPELAVSNAVGSIAAQTAFLAIVDISYRRANLEHAAASAANVMQGALLVTLLAMILVASGTPEFSLLGVHPMTVLMFATYAYGFRLVSLAHTHPMWRPKSTMETREDKPDARNARVRLAPQLWKLSALVPLVIASGWTLAETGVALADATGLTQTAVGAVFTGVASSLPELVTALAAVRQGALTLAVGGIIGGNAFDTLIVAVSDLAYRGGSVLHAIGGGAQFLVAVALLQAGFLLMGLMHRERHGIANIGTESVLILVIYVSAVVILFAA